MDIQPVFNEYKAVTYMFQNFSETDDQCSEAWKKQPRKPLNNMHHHDTMKTIGKAYSVFCKRGSLPYIARTETKENLSGCFFYYQ